MDSLNAVAPIVEAVLEECARRYATPDARMLTIFDPERGHFLVVEEGWIGNRHLYNPFVHIEWRDGKLWLQQDYTNHGIAQDLVASGIPEARMVLGFKHPSLRAGTEFAVA